MRTVLVAPFVRSAAGTIKLASLYFDEIVLHQRWLLRVEETGPDGAKRTGIVREVIPAVDATLLEAIDPLIQEGLVSIQEPPPSPLSTPARESVENLFSSGAASWITETPDALRFQIHDQAFDEVHARLAGPLAPGALFDLSAVLTYYQGLFQQAVGATLRGEQLLTTSQELRSLLVSAAGSDVVSPQRLNHVLPGYVPPQFAVDVLSLGVIDASDLDAHDLLEVRHQLSDELAAFRIELQKLQHEFTEQFGIDRLYREGQSLAAALLAPRLHDIEQKLRGSRVRALRRLVESLEKPDAYVPLLGSAFAGVPLAIALSVSLGLVSARVALEAMENRQEVRKDGLFYLVKLSKKLTPHASRSAPLTPLAPASSPPQARYRLMWSDDVTLGNRSS